MDVMISSLSLFFLHKSPMLDARENAIMIRSRRSGANFRREVNNFFFGIFNMSLGGYCGWYGRCTKSSPSLESFSYFFPGRGFGNCDVSTLSKALLNKGSRSECRCALSSRRQKNFTVYDSKSALFEFCQKYL